MRGDGLGPAATPQVGPQRLSHAQPQTSQKHLPAITRGGGQARLPPSVARSALTPSLPCAPPACSVRARPGWVALLAGCRVASSKAPPSLSHLARGALHTTPEHAHDRMYTFLRPTCLHMPVTQTCLCFSHTHVHIGPPACMGLGPASARSAFAQDAHPRGRYIPSSSASHPGDLSLTLLSLPCPWQTIEFDQSAGAVLRIQPLRTPRDENVYECVAQNSVGEVTVHAKLTVLRGTGLPGVGGGGTRPRVLESLKMLLWISSLGNLYTSAAQSLPVGI